MLYIETLNKRLYNLTRDVGAPTQVSTIHMLDEWKELCSNPSPLTFHAVLDIRPVPQIKMCHQTEIFFGTENITLRDFVSAIHPDWRAIYLCFSYFSYFTVFEKSPDSPIFDLTYSINVPLRCSNGKYYWFKQFATFIEIDKDNRLVSHLNSYMRIANYESLLSTGPFVLLKTEEYNEWTEKIRRSTEEYILSHLYNILTQRQRELLNCYRVVVSEVDAGIRQSKVSSSLMADIKGVSLKAIRNYNTEILRKSQEFFRMRGVDTIIDLARLLNGLFGNPLNKC